MATQCGKATISSMARDYQEKDKEGNNCITNVITAAPFGTALRYPKRPIAIDRKQSPRREF